MGICFAVSSPPPAHPALLLRLGGGRSLRDGGIRPVAPAITTLTVFIYPMSQELGWSRTLIAGAVSTGALSSIALSPAIGWAIDRYGSRPVLVAGVLTVGAS